MSFKIHRFLFLKHFTIELDRICDKTHLFFLSFRLGSVVTVNLGPLSSFFSLCLFASHNFFILEGDIATLYPRFWVKPTAAGSWMIADRIGVVWTGISVICTIVIENVLSTNLMVFSCIFVGNFNTLIFGYYLHRRLVYNRSTPTLTSSALATTHDYIF